MERDSAYAAEQIFNVIDARASSKLPVVVTTNLTMEELEHPASMQYARIYDRVLEMCPVRLKLIGTSRRRGNAEARKQPWTEITAALNHSGEAVSRFYLDRARSHYDSER